MGGVLDVYGRRGMVLGFSVKLRFGEGVVILSCYVELSLIY